MHHHAYNTAVAGKLFTYGTDEKTVSLDLAFDARESLRLVCRSPQGWAREGSMDELRGALAIARHYREEFKVQGNEDTDVYVVCVLDDGLCNGPGGLDRQ
jgi:hypothetical protein